MTIKDVQYAALLDLMASDRMPTRARWRELESMGFAAGRVVKDDPIFRHAQVPKGWRKEVALHNQRIFHVLDERGIRRVDVIYKATQDDRHSSCAIVDVGREAADDVVYGEDKPTLPTFWEAMTRTERAAFVEVLDEAVARENEGVCAAEEAERARTVLESARPTREGSAPMPVEGPFPDDVTPDMTLAMQCLQQLNDGQRRRILCWFCARCARYLEPGRPACSCPE